jgi:hypothetical protein
MSQATAQNPSVLTRGRHLILSEEVELPAAQRPHVASFAAIAATSCCRWRAHSAGAAQLSDRLPGDRVIALLDAAFDAQATAIEQHGGGLAGVHGLFAPETTALAPT